MPRLRNRMVCTAKYQSLVVVCTALVTTSVAVAGKAGASSGPAVPTNVPVQADERGSEAQVIVLTGGTFATVGTDVPTGSDGHALYVPGEIILKLSAHGRPGAAAKAEALQRLALTHGLREAAAVFPHAGAGSLGRIHRAKVKPGMSVPQACQQLRADPAVEWAEPNYIYLTSATLPNDPDFGQQWYLLNSGQSGGLPDADVDAPEAWDVTTGDPSVVIAVVDTGVKYDHADLAGNIWTNPGESGDGKETDGVDNDGNGYIDDVRGWDFVSVAAGLVAAGEDPGPPDNDPQDVLGHGTHVAGIAAAASNNAAGVTGVAWNCRIMPVRAGFKRTDGAGVLEETDAAAGIVYAADNGASVINMSWGGGGNSTLIREAVDYARSRDVCLVAAAGNSSSSGFFYPAGYPGVLAVAASDRYDNKASFSNFGAGVDLIAPGVAIHNTWVDGSYADLNGTSMASPLVAGIAALVRSRFPNRDADAVATTIISSTDPFASASYVGTGRVNAFKAVQMDEVCTASIASPQPASMVKDTINVVGSAAGPAFASYTLSYSTSTGSPSFTPLMTSSTPVVNGSLGVLDTAPLPEGPLLLRLTVTSTQGRISVCQVLAEISRSAWFRAGGEITSSPKSVRLAGRSDYGIVFGTSEGMIYLVAPNGQAMPGWPVVSDSLVGYTSAAVADLNGDDVEDIVVHSNNTLEAYGQDGTALPGWPKDLTSYVSGNSPCGSPVISDIDGDGDLEVIVGHTYRIFAFHHNGSPVAGWPISQSNAWGPIFSTPAVADLDHDGDAEICIKMYGGNGQPADAYLVHHNATPVVGWPKLGLERSHTSSPVLADIDGDGNLDIVVSLHDYGYVPSGNHVRVHAWRLDGSSLPGFPVTGSWNTVPINNAVGDVDGDGFLEILVGNNHPTPPYYAVQAWNHDGTPFAAPWPLSAALCAMSSSPVIADLNGNRNEILMGVGGCYTSDPGALYAWSSDGTPLPEWPKSVSAPLGHSSPLVIDADRDGIPEIYIGSANGCIYRFTGSAAAYRDAPQWNQVFHDARNTNSPKAPADFDFDGDVDTADVDRLFSCARGPNIPKSPGCTAFDLDDDDDVDQDDFGIFQRCYSGSGVVPKPNCGQ